MRTSKELGTTAIYIEELDEGGGNLLFCDRCGHEFADRTEPDHACICPSCDTELFYRPWFNW